MLPLERQNKILEILDRRQAATVEELCGELYTSGATIRRDLQILENNGLIRREITPYDGRFKRIIATEKAQGLRAQVMADLTALETELTAGVTPEQLDVFFQVTEILLKNLSDERSAPRRRRKEGSAL